MSIASHISNITLERIKIVRMILNFKITKNDQIMFLWCSSLRIENNLDKKQQNNNNLDQYKECDINKIKMTVPDTINIFKFSTKNKPIKPLKDSNCLNCDRNLESYRLYEISFKALIESHENRKRDKSFFMLFNNFNMTSSGVEIIPYVENKNYDNNYNDTTKRKNFKNLLIPKVISAIYPKMKYEDYNLLKKDYIFSSKIAYVCDSCYLDITRYCTLSGINTENVLRTLKPSKAIEIGAGMLATKDIQRRDSILNSVNMSTLEGVDNSRRNSSMFSKTVNNLNIINQLNKMDKNGKNNNNNKDIIIEKNLSNRNSLLKRKNINQKINNAKITSNTHRLPVINY
jgi:hypothetical protein